MKKLLLIVALLVGITTSWGQYCLPTYGNACTSGDYINDFTIDSYSNLGTNCAFPGANNYSDYTGLGSVVTLQQSMSYNVTCAPGAAWGQYFAVWIDFNQDGDFDEVNEFFDIGYSVAGGTVSNTITIPVAALGGNTQLRVLCHFGTGLINQPDACLAQTWGEVEDYIVTLGAAPDYEAATVSIDAPLSGCGLGTESVMATFQNNGSLVADTFVVCYSSNGGPWMCDTATGLALATGATYQHTFSDLLDLSVSGDYYIDVSVSYAGDTLNMNDTIFAYLAQSIPIVTTFPYIEDFESGTGGWSMTNIANSSWELAVPNNLIINSAASDSMAWVTNATGLYNSNENGYVQGPCFDLSALDSTDIIAMDVWWNSEFSWDGANITTSIDGGATWNLLGNMGDPTNWYTDNAIDGNPGGYQEGWTGRTSSGNGSDGWVTACHSLGASLAGQSGVLFRVNFGSDGSVEDEGFAFDNFAIGSPTLISPAADFAACGPFQASYPELGSEYIWYAEDTATFVVTVIDTTVNGDLIIPNTTLTDTTFNLIAVFKDSLGCSSSDTTLVTIFASPYNVLTDVSICFDQFATFSVDTSSNYSYLWNDASTGSSATYNTEGTVSVTVTNTSNTCAHTASAFLTVSVPVDIPALAEICAGESVVVDAGVYDSYLWSTGETTQSITITTFGIYTVQAIDSVIGCTTFDLIEVVDGCVGLDELNGIAMRIYPNPSTGEFNYSIDNMVGVIELMIFDVTGKIIKTGEISEANGTIDLSSYEAGIYILKLQAGDAIKIIRLVKK